MTSNQLKILALLAMTCDHVGKQLLPQYPILQIIGRLAFPIFAYMIAEGCRYTKNRKKYLLTIAIEALICQLVYAIAMGSLYQCVLVTFSLSIGVIYVLDNAGNKKTVVAYIGAAMMFLGICFVCIGLPQLLRNTDFAIDYGLWGVLLPVAIYFGRTKMEKLLLMGILLFPIAWSIGGIQWYAFAALLLQAFYHGRRGKWKMKNLFYIYYPLHLVCIYLIGVVW